MRICHIQTSIFFIDFLADIQHWWHQRFTSILSILRQGDAESRAASTEDIRGYVGIAACFLLLLFDPDLMRSVCFFVGKMVKMGLFGTYHAKVSGCWDTWEIYSNHPSHLKTLCVACNAKIRRKMMHRYMLILAFHTPNKNSKLAGTYLPRIRKTSWWGSIAWLAQFSRNATCMTSRGLLKLDPWYFFLSIHFRVLRISRFRVGFLVLQSEKHCSRKAT